MRDDPWTALLVLADAGSVAAEAEVTHRVARFFLELHFVVSFQRPNVVIVTGSQSALVAAVARLERDPAAGAELIRDSTLCAGAWSPPRESPR